MRLGLCRDTASQACDTARGSPVTRRPAPTTRLAGGAKTRPLARAWARLCAPGCAVGSSGCALGAPSLFLDSILFLSHWLDTVHHKNFSNFFLIK